MATFPRYAIYYAPAPGSGLDRFGSGLLGYDAYRGVDMPFPDGINIPHWRELTQDPQIRLSRHAQGANGTGPRQARR